MKNRFVPFSMVSKRPFMNGYSRPILLKKSTSNSTAEKYASEIEI
ncbi:hypothetical protein PS907_00594 [Pseudomonas fluorescens]|nr:hypothetical protein PS907_00594 [Pseudomonas fluorescens]